MNRWAALGVLCLGSIMVMLDGSVLNVAIPALSTGLPASFDQVLWVISAYTITWAALLITAGRLGDLYGHRPLFVVGLLVFTCGSAACGLAQNPTQLIAARVAQGVGGALLSPQTLAMLQVLFDASSRANAISVYAGLITLGPVIAQPLGGALVSVLGWRWIFFVNLPLGALAILLTFWLVPDLRIPVTRSGLDPVGIVLLGAALFCLSFGLLEGTRYDWSSVDDWVSIPEILAASIVLLGAFGVWNSRRASPLVPPVLLRNRTCVHMALLFGGASAAMAALFLPLSIYFQTALALSPLQTGLTMLPMPLTVLVLNTFVANRLAARIGAGLTLAFGLVCLGTGTAIIYLSSGMTADWPVLFSGFVVVAAGPGLMFAPLTTTAVRFVAPEVAGAASGVLNTSGQLGGVLGSAMVGAIFQSAASSVDAFHSALLIPFVVAVVGAASCVRMLQPTVTTGLKASWSPTAADPNTAARQLHP